ncbi:MAG: hypothetical protein R3D25_22115 [Geminicoccaceae bacterium]
MSLAPGATIGVLGGGQLGRMTALAAARLGCRTAVLAPEAEAPAADVAWRHWQAAYDDAGALAEFLAVVDVVTLEWENVPVSALTAIAAQRPTRPGAEVLRITQDRLLEKSFVAGLDVPVAPFVRSTMPRHSWPASIGSVPGRCSRPGASATTARGRKCWARKAARRRPSTGWVVRP